MSRFTPRKNRNNAAAAAAAAGASSGSTVGTTILTPASSTTHSHPRQQQSDKHQPRAHNRNLSTQMAIHLQLPPQYFAAACSDYESDAAAYMRENPPPSKAAFASRNNEQVNMAVLKRYIPNIGSIKTVTSNAVMYTMDMAKCEWMKGGIDGAMFVVSQTSDDIFTGMATGGCIFVLNRRGLNNITLNLAEVAGIELNQQLLIFDMEYGSNTHSVPSEDRDRVIGLWIHAQDGTTATTCYKTIEKLWKMVQDAKNRTKAQEAKGKAWESAALPTSKPPEATAAKVNLLDLFGKQLC